MLVHVYCGSSENSSLWIFQDLICWLVPPFLSQPGDCAERVGGEKSACASRTKKVHRAEARDVPLRRKKKIPAEELKQHKLRGWKSCSSERTAIIAQTIPVHPRKMGFPTIFGGRRSLLKLFLLQFVAFQTLNARPSPLIRFPGDDTPRTDKEVALVSFWFFSSSDYL